MKNTHIIPILLFLLMSVSFCSSTNNKSDNTDKIVTYTDNEIKEIWTDAKLTGIISFKLFRMAMTGYNKIDFKKNDILTIIDYSKPSTEKRFYVIDIKQKKLLYRCYVAHGMNSGSNYASDYSNQPNSKKSSLGFYTTAETYSGKHGYSLKLDGLEKGINDNARKRSVVIHGADYVSSDFINKHGRLGRSWGCPALPVELSKEIIDIISGGRCIFIFGNDPNYMKNSKYIEKNN